MGLDTPWSRARKLRSTLQEERLNDLPHGRKGVNSGRFWQWKRDGRIGNFLIEARTTEAKSYRIERDEFMDLKKQALTEPGGLLPAMQVTIGDLDLIVIDLVTFSDMNARLLYLEQDDAQG